MVVKTQLSQDDLLIMLASYNLGDFLSSRPIAAGTVQSNFYLETSKGAFVFKYYENRSFESVRFEANVIHYIRKQNFPCPAVITNKHRQSVGIFQDKPFVIFDYIAGQSVSDFNPEQHKQVIQLAARLQNITKGYRPSLRKFRWNYTPELVLKLAQERATELNTETAYAKVRWFEQTLANLKLPQSLPKGICHADYDPSNVFFEGDELVALLDFDDANYTYLLFDLVSLIDGLAWPHDGEFQPDVARQIIQDYTRVRKLTAVEKQHLIDVHKLSILFDGIWFFARGTADNFYEKRKVEFLDSIGRDDYHQILLGDSPV